MSGKFYTIPGSSVFHRDRECTRLQRSNQPVSVVTKRENVNASRECYTCGVSKR